jgi:hypothetical protein
MIAKARSLLVAALFLLPAAAFAQPPTLPPAPVPVAPPGPPPAPPTLQPPQSVQPAQPSPYSLPPVQPSPQVMPGPAPSTGLADPGRNGWPIYGAPSDYPTFFVGLDVDILKPTYKNHLQGTVTFPDGTTDTLDVPNVPLGWTGSPTFQFGYKLPDSCGEFLIGYRFITSQGTQNENTDFGDAFVKSRLSVNVIDFDYNTARYSPGPRWDLRWTIGARIATVFYDTSIDNTAVFESASSYFYGAGPHAGFELERKLPVFPSFGFFVKGDAAVLIGSIKQQFTETVTDASGNTFGGSTWQRKTQSVETVNVQAGISYTPPNFECLKFMLGYEFEYWFSVGRSNQSQGDLQTQGVFLRGQFDF